MKPLNECPASSLRQIQGVLCDIDDTLSWQGKLPAVAFSALEDLRAAGLFVIPITGRPAGWCDHIARMWPVDGVVGENGAFYFHYDDSSRKMVRKYWRSDEQRRDDRERLERIGKRILKEVTGTAISADQGYREADLAIDFCEDVESLPMTDVTRIVDIFHSEGAVAKISSIHVNGWYGNYDKLSMTREMLRDLFEMDIDSHSDSISFVGDSANDAPMFGFFNNAVGVSNVIDFVDAMEEKPAWITTKPGGAGFAEFAETLLEAKKS